LRKSRINPARQMAVPEIKQLDTATDRSFVGITWRDALWSRNLVSHVDVFCVFE
jgi:hypothetical protein